MIKKPQFLAKEILPFQCRFCLVFPFFKDFKRLTPLSRQSLLNVAKRESISYAAMRKVQIKQEQPPASSHSIIC